ncbi:alcohol dehydrogenase catalytic domain-containing protein [Streptomyces sp. NPDC005151]
MRAMILEEFGAPLVLSEIAKPVAGPGQVLVRVKASGVNPLDTKIRAGKAAHARSHPPAVLGLDLAGLVEAVGAGVAGFVPGDEVYGLTGGVGELQGSLAEYAVVDAQLLAHKPASLSMREAAALPLGCITAWEGLMDRAHVRSGQKVSYTAAPAAPGTSPSRSPVPRVPKSSGCPPCRKPRPDSDGPGLPCDAGGAVTTRRGGPGPPGSCPRHRA